LWPVIPLITFNELGWRHGVSLPLHDRTSAGFLVENLALCIVLVTTKHTKDTKGWDIPVNQDFVLFVPFVVNTLPHSTQTNYFLGKDRANLKKNRGEMLSSAEEARQGLRK
jgi:hypothetical protein